MKRKQFDLVESVRSSLAEYEAHKAGTRSLVETKFVIPRADVKTIRNNLNLSQKEFADRYALSVSSLRNWEQGCRDPEQPISILFHLISKYPKAVAREIKAFKRASAA